MITCSSIKFSRHQMGYDLRRNESVTTDYEDMFATNMYAKVGSQMGHSETVSPAPGGGLHHPRPRPDQAAVPLPGLHGAPHAAGRTPAQETPQEVQQVGRSVMCSLFPPGTCVRNAGRAEFEESSQEVRDMVLASVDQAVDKVISELRRAGMFRNSVVLLTTDNGGGPWYSNTPLRGTKETLFEGGIRAASFLLSPLLQVRSSH